jgi:hypothetical protein
MLDYWVGDGDPHRSKGKFKSFLFKTILDSLPQNMRGTGITIEHFPRLALSVTIARPCAARPQSHMPCAARMTRPKD